jgi:hypothetical protein
MRSNLVLRNNRLSQTEIDEMFDQSPKGHLKYRLTMLCTWNETKDSMGLQHNICGFESALLASRMFMQFLGLAIDHSPQLRLVEDRTYFSSGGQSDEVKIKDLGGDWVEIQNLCQVDRDLLARTYHAASKACAHLTLGSNHGFSPEELPKAIDLISNLLKTHLYEQKGIKMEKHYN